MLGLDEVQGPARTLYYVGQSIFWVGLLGWLYCYVFEKMRGRSIFIAIYSCGVILLGLALLFGGKTVVGGICFVVMGAFGLVGLPVHRWWRARRQQNANDNIV